MEKPAKADIANQLSVKCARVVLVIARNGMVSRQISDTFTGGANLIVVCKTDEKNIHRFASEFSPDIVLLDAGLGVEFSEDIRRVCQNSSVLTVIPQQSNKSLAHGMALIPVLASAG